KISLHSGFLSACQPGCRPDSYSPAPCLLASHHAPCHDDNGLNL
ncbi:hypothetical protein LEMLEM_LOCUS7942, partial [Lemmus lemmus]